MAEAIKCQNDAPAFFSRVFPGLQHRRLRRSLPMHVARAIRRQIIADHVKVVSESALEPLIRPLDIDDREIDLFLRNDLRIADTLSVYRKIEIFHKETEGVSRRCFYF